jgi:hypothetical protein
MGFIGHFVDSNVIDGFKIKIYFTLDGFVIGWMYGFHGFAPIGTDFFKKQKSVPIGTNP